MPRNIVLESIKHHLFRAIERGYGTAGVMPGGKWKEFFETVSFSSQGSDNVSIRWSSPVPGELLIQKKSFSLYQRGDLSADKSQDPQAHNQMEADVVADQIAALIGAKKEEVPLDLLIREQSFHDKWATGTDPSKVAVKESFEACTAPENRFILTLLGDLKGKKVLDLGCGLGEAAVYFAMQGAVVTACDLSPGMLELATQVAHRYGVSIQTHQSSAETTNLPAGYYDVVYAANILHHSNMPVVLDEIRRILSPTGIFVSWDPIAHNPLINIYRRLAAQVRTVDEHPIRFSELALFKARFRSVQWRCFWLTTLLVFVRFFVWERINPSKERYWKKIIDESKRLEGFYRPLERMDTSLLKWLPWLNRYCWNIVLWCRP